MKKLASICITVLIFGCYALSQDDASAPKRAPLLLVQEIPLPNVEGRIDHFTFDPKRKRVIGAALGNNTLRYQYISCGSKPWITGNWNRWWMLVGTSATSAQ